MKRATHQPKAVVSFGYQNYLLPLTKATQLIELIAGAVSVEYDFDRGSRNYRLSTHQPPAPSLQIVTDEQLDIAPRSLRALSAPPRTP